MKKRLLALSLLLVWILSLAPLSALAAEPSGVTASGTCGETLTWTLEDGVLTISGTGKMENYQPGADPLQWQGRQHAIKEVVIQPGVTSIGSYAFYCCSNLTSITIPDSVTSIGGSAFENCSSLASVTIPGSVASIGERMFASCDSLTSVTLLPGVTSIGESAFYGCDNLTSITIPDSVTSIGEYAFALCNNLTSITIPGSVTSIGRSAFYLCSNLTSVTILDGVTSIGESAFFGCESLRSITIPASVTSMGDSVFSNCFGLTGVAILGSVPRIGRNMFSFCINLTEVMFPASVTSIEYGAFGECRSLKNVYYTGSVAQLDAIRLEEDNEALYGVTIYLLPYDVGSGPFVDVQDTSSWYYDPVLWAVSEGVTTGATPLTFQPYSGCTRAQAVTFLWRAAGKPEPETSVSPFTDVQDINQYYYKAVLWAVEQGITTGATETTFEPGSTCTRGQIVTFLWRLEGEQSADAANFTDVTPGQYYYDAVNWAVKQGVTNGTSATKFSPEETCTRGHIVTFLYRDLAQ